MKIVVIIVAYQGDRWIPRCLDSIQPDHRHEIRLLIVNNYQTPCLDSLPPPKVPHEIIKPPRVMGFAEANNFALVQGGCDGDVVVLLNQDTWSESNWIPVCANTLRDHPELNAVSPTVRQYDDDRLDPNFATCLADENRQPGGDTVETIGNLPAVALMIRTSTLKAVGPFDPIFGSYYEDYDLCRRIRTSGGMLAFVSNAWIRHFSGSASSTPEARRKRMIQIIRNRLIHSLRTQETPRWLGLSKYYFRDLPINILRGIKKTASSQPLSVTWAANWRLLRILWRISSKRRDQAAWHRYLEQLNWKQIRDLF